MEKKVVFKSYCQNQEFLLPKRTDDFVVKGHIARLISQIVDGMDVQHIVATYKGGGASSYNPRMLLKVWILGFVYRVYSCRILAKNLRECLPFIWISGNQQPDFRTLNNFRLRLNDDIKMVFKQIVVYALDKGIIKGEDVFVDHTKIEANSNKYKVVWKKRVFNRLEEIDAELAKLFKHVDEVNEKENIFFGDGDLAEQERIGFDEEKVKEIIEDIDEKIKEEKISREEGREEKGVVRRVKRLLEMKQNYEQQKEILQERRSFSRTDTDAVAMMMKDKKTIRPAYNEGIATEKGFVIDYTISDSSADSVSFVPLMKGVINNLGKAPENAHADGAYGNEETMTFLEKNKIKNFLKYNTYYRERSKDWREKNQKTETLTYDKKNDEFTCRNGIKLKFEKNDEEITKTGYKRKIKIYKTEKNHCNCPFHKTKKEILNVSWKYERLRKQARQNLNSTKGIELRKRRGNEVESVFGDEKLNKNKRRYNLRSTKKVNLEAGLYYSAHNIRKIHEKTTQNINKNFF